jgi:geranylgeranyl diphosphate synthase type II
MVRFLSLKECRINKDSEGEVMSFDEDLSAAAGKVNDIIAKFLPAEKGYARTVIEAMNYSVNAGGKRLRPLFIYETDRMYGGDTKEAEPFMAAIEMIHTYSLVHDDLPEMDNDEYRRGRRTTHAVYGPGMGVLAGDGLLNYAYETVLKAILDETDETMKARKARAAYLLAVNAGIYGMVGGQCADLESEGGAEPADSDTLMYIHRHKTACMIESGFQIGAILAGAPEKDIEDLGKIAEKIGVAFQIEDDILDVVGNSEEVGKTLGKDAAEEKATYVSVHGLARSREDVKRLTREAIGLYDGLSAKNDFLRTLIESMMTRTK